MSGAEDRIRTGDLLLGKEALYQLSYFRNVRAGPSVQLIPVARSATSRDRQYSTCRPLLQPRKGDILPSSGAGNRTRTGDTQLGKLVLYQLSYSRAGDCLVGGIGLEPMNLSRVRRSLYQLS